MQIETEYIKINTKGHTDIVDVTSQVQETLKKSGLQEGHLTVFISGSTAGVTTVEYEPGLLKDIPEALEKIAPTGRVYHHDATWGDGNGYAHVRASMVGASFTVPFVNGRMLLGTWQQIIVLDFDNRSRSRNVVVQLMGE